MDKNYQWRMRTSFVTDTEMSYGVEPSSWMNWQTDTIGDRDGGTVQYWYRDANVSTGGQWLDTNSSRAVLSVTQSWTTSVDSRNYLTINLRTTINSIIRDDLRGTNQNTPGRNITIYENGVQILTVDDYQVATAHTIYGGTIARTQTIVLAPGENAQSEQYHLHNRVLGSSPSYDDIRFGVQFKNPLPKDYRPGAVLKPENNTPVWLSHNRTNKAAHILDNASQIHWKEMRTVGGDSSAKGDAPSILKANSSSVWYNQKLLGKQ